MKRVGLVLGAGGHTGQAFHLGALTALAEVGFDGRDAQVLVGTSAGSLVAAGFAAGLSVHDQRAQLLGEPLSPDGARLLAASRAATPGTAAPAAPAVAGPLAPWSVLAAARRPWGVRPGAVAAGLMPAGRQSTEIIRRPLHALFGDAWPERDLRLCAVRARDARRVVFGAPGAPPADVGSAVAASCAIPAWFAPVQIGADRYVDGGVHSPTNADVLAADGLDVVAVLSPMSIAPGAGHPADVGLRLLVRRYLTREVRQLRRGGTRVVVLQPGADELAAMGHNPMSGGRARAVLAAAERSVRARMAGSGELADALRPATGG